ncbi:MAG: hypothetical protein ABJQ29_07450 [Luteolibacter sp.]
MKRIISLLLVTATLLHAQADTTHHRKVYAEINANQANFAKSSANLEEDGVEIQLKGFSQNGTLRKIEAEVLGEHGSSSQEYYLENGLPLFIFTTSTNQDFNGKVTGRFEDRYYFRNGVMFKWLDSEKKSVDPSSGEFQQEGQFFAESTQKFIRALSAKPAPKAPAGNVTSGVFTGIDEGDYMHWMIRPQGGEIISFFILNTTPEIEKVIHNPGQFLGKSCRVTWRNTVINSPNAGGNIDITELLGVQWLD